MDLYICFSKNFLVDNRGQFKNYIEYVNIHTCTLVAEAPKSNDIVERHNAI